jgi:hypothetical protein
MSDEITPGRGVDIIIDSCRRTKREMLENGLVMGKLLLQP